VRILYTETKWGRPSAEGLVPIRLGVTERWQTLDQALAETITRLVTRLPFPYVVRWAHDRKLVEIDISDPDDTLIALWDAAHLERRMGLPATEIFTHMARHKDELDRIAEVLFPEALRGIKRRKEPTR